MMQFIKASSAPDAPVSCPTKLIPSRLFLPCSMDPKFLRNQRFAHKGIQKKSD